MSPGWWKTWLNQVTVITGPTYPRSANATVRRLARASSAPVTKTSTAGKAGFPGSWERKASIQMWQLQKVSKISAKHGGFVLKIFIVFLRRKLAESFLNSPQLTLLTPFNFSGCGHSWWNFPPVLPQVLRLALLLLQASREDQIQCCCQAMRKHLQGSQMQTDLHQRSIG